MRQLKIEMLRMEISTGGQPGPTPKIPERCRNRPRWGGMVVPFTTFVNPNDKRPDFRITNLENWRLCVDKKLCGICGQRLGLKIYFIGGPSCTNNRLFFDPPMHKECADYSIAVCPFIRDKERKYSERPAKCPVGQIVKVHEQVSSAKTKMYLMSSSGFKVVGTGTPGMDRMIKAYLFILIKEIIPNDGL